MLFKAIIVSLWAATSSLAELSARQEDAVFTNGVSQLVPRILPDDCSSETTCYKTGGKWDDTKDLAKDAIERFCVEAKAQVGHDFIQDDGLIKVDTAYRWCMQLRKGKMMQIELIQRVEGGLPLYVDACIQMLLDIRDKCDRGGYCFAGEDRWWRRADIGSGCDS